MFGLFLLFVFAIKLVIVFQLKDHILLRPDTTTDTAAYYGLAQRVMAGDLGLGPGLYFVSPLYIYFLALVISLTGSLAWVRVLQIALGTAAVGAIFATAREWFSPRVAWIAAVVAALTGHFTFYEVTLLRTSVDGVLTAAALWALTMALKRESTRWYLAAGVAFGVASLNGPNTLLAVAAVAVVLLLQRRIRAALILGAGVAAALSPVVIRNAVVAQQFALVSSQGGMGFEIGNGEGATGLFRPLPGIRPTIEGQAEDTRKVAEAAVGHSLSDAQVSDFFWNRTWAWIRQHPGAWLRLMATKTYYLLNAQHFALPLSYPFFAYDTNTLLRFLPVGPALLIPLGITGLIFALWRSRGQDRRNYLVWLTFVPAYGFSVTLFVIAERYRLPLLVPFAIGVAVTVDAVYSAIRERRHQAAAALIGASLVLGVVANWPLHFPDGDGRGEERVRMAENSARFGDGAEAERWVNLALERTTQPALAHYRVGVQFTNSGQWPNAIKHLTAASSIDPKAAAIEQAVGQTIDAVLATGDRALVIAALSAASPAELRDPVIALQLGRAAMVVKAPELAEPLFARAAELAPSDANAHFRLGGAFLVLRKFDEAVRELKVARTLDPGNTEIASTLAIADQLARAIRSK